MAYRLEELVDITRLQTLLESFSAVSGVPTCIVAKDGSLLSCAGWKDICLRYHRRNPESLQCCENSNARVADELSRTNGIMRYTCPHGFMKAAFAITVDGEHLGTMYTGQMLQTEPDREQFRLQARRYGFDEEAYLAELQRVPVMEQERLDATLACLSQLTGMIIDMAVMAKGAHARSAEVDRLAERYGSIIDTTADGFWIVDGQGRCLEANELCCAMHGYTREELKGMTVSDLEAVESPEETAAHIALVKREGFGRFETSHHRKDGSSVEVEVSTSYLATEDVFVAFLRDITEQKRSNEALQSSERRFRSLFESMQEGVVLHELTMDEGGTPADYRILDVNPSFTAITGIDRRDAVGALGSELYGTGTPPYLYEFSRPLFTGHPFSFETYFPPMDKHFQISVFSPKENQFATVFFDISDRKLAEKELQDSLLRTQEIVQSIPSGLYIYHYEEPDRLVLLEGNEAARTLTGLDPHECVGMEFNELWPEARSAGILDAYLRVMQTGEPYKTEDIHYKDDKLEGAFAINAFRMSGARLGVAFENISDRKRAERALKESEERFRNLFELAPVPYQSIDLNGNLLEVNEAWCRMLGYERSRVLGTSMGEYLAEYARPLLLERLSRLAREGSMSGVACQLLRKDGGLVEVIVEGSVGRDSQGRFTQTHCILFDVTERKRAEEALRKSEEDYRSIVETTTEWIWASDLAGYHTFSNATVTDILGYQVDELIGHPASHFMHEDDWRAVESMLLRLGAEKQGWRGLVLRWRHKDGSYRYLESNASPVIIAGECVGYRGADRDVTERKRAEDELKASQQRLQFLLTATPTVIYTCRPSGDFGATFVSDNVRSLMGYEPKDFLEDSAFWLEHIHADDRPRIVAELSKLFTAGSHSHEYRFRTRDGSYRWMHDEIVMVRDADGTPLECIGCWLDVTDRHEVEQEVRHLNEQLEQRVAERTSELESFCYSISHDLRAPLRAIDGFTTILREEYEPHFDELGKDLCGRIGSNAVRMGALIDDLLAFSRVGRSSLEQEPLDMAALARSAFEELLALEDRGRVEFRLAGLPDAVADRATMGQVWANLLGNALKYSSREPLALIEVGGRQEGGENVYFVRDNGVGFDMAYVDKLFGVFLRVHSPVEFPGTGVGLAIVERIVQRHGGRVWAEGEVGKGATFFFALPVRAQLQ